MSKKSSKVAGLRAMREADVEASESSGRERYATLIRRSVTSTVESIIETGRLLINAKAELPHEEFGAMVEEDLPFGDRMARIYVSIATSAHIGERKRVSGLPPSVGTLYELSRLDDEGWRAIEPHLSPELKRKDVRPFLPSKRNGSDGEIVIEDDRETCSVGDLSDLSRTFGTIYADPPWLYGNQGTRGSTGDHYSGMTPDEVAELPITHLVADTAHLHLWTTNAFLFDARRVMEAWGFDYKSCFVWVKPQMGMGNYWRVSHEFCLLGVRGAASFRERDEMSWREWPRGQHSAKPHEMYEIIERVSPGPYLELFARRQRQGWTSWGNEIERDLFFQEAV